MSGIIIIHHTSKLYIYICLCPCWKEYILTWLCNINISIIYLPQRHALLFYGYQISNKSVSRYFYNIIHTTFLFFLAINWRNNFADVRVGIRVLCGLEKFAIKIQSYVNIFLEYSIKKIFFQVFLNLYLSGFYKTKQKWLCTNIDISILSES